MQQCLTKDECTWFEAMPGVWFGKARTGEARVALTGGATPQALGDQQKLSYSQLPLEAFVAAAEAVSGWQHPRDREAIADLCRRLEKSQFSDQRDDALEANPLWLQVKAHLGVVA